MKKIIIILLLLLGSTALFCQIQMNGSIEYKIDKSSIPYKLKHTSALGRNDGVWRPLTADFYLELISPTIPYTENRYSYDSTGVLHKETAHYQGDAWDYYVGIFNETFTKEGFDFEDTLTYYNKKGNTVVPLYRIYGDYHFYDRFPEDSLYYVAYSDTWDDVTKEWKPAKKTYQGHFDTTLFVIRELYDADFINGEWVINIGSRVLREYNEDGLATFHILQIYNKETGEYETVRGNETVYNEDNIPVETHNYDYLGNDTWKLTVKSTDMQYVEWYPNGQELIKIDIGNGPEYVGIADKRVKDKSFIQWKLNDNDEWVKYATVKKEWDLNGTKSHIDTAYLFYDDIPFLYYMFANLYDERGNYIQRWYEGFNPSDMYGNVELVFGEKYCFHTSYHSLYDYPEIKSEWEWRYDRPAQQWDSTFTQRREYYDWVDVSKPVSITELEPSASAALFIFPNPVSGAVIIAAASEMQQLSIFDITGRLVASPSPAGERVVFDAGALPQGVYLVKALLRDGVVRTGKVVVR